MPSRPKTPCRHPGCAALVPYGTKYCEVHKPMHPEEVRSAESRGYGRAWQMFWDQGNWQALCHRHHSMKTRANDNTPTYHY